MSIQRLLWTTIWLAVIFSFAAAGAGVAPVHAQTKERLEIGADMPMPDRPMKNAADSQVSLGTAAGAQGTLVVFWCNSCPWVDRYEDRLVSIAREYQDRGIGVIAVNPNDARAYPDDSFTEMQQQASSGDYPFPYVVDEGSRLARVFGASRTPEVFLFDGQRKLVYTGTIDDNPRTAEGVEKTYVRNALDALIEGNEITEPTTQAFGCTIKWSSS